MECTQLNNIQLFAKYSNLFISVPWRTSSSQTVASFGFDLDLNNLSHLGQGSGRKCSDSTISCCCEAVIYGVGNKVGRWGEAQRSGELSNFDWVTDSCAHISQWVKGVRYWGGEINRVFDH